VQSVYEFHASGAQAKKIIGGFCSVSRPAVGPHGDVMAFRAASKCGTMLGAPTEYSFYVADVAGSWSRELVESGGSYRWDPSGDRLYMTGADGGVYLAEANGWTVRRIADGSNPVPSPDGKYIAFTCASGGLCLMERDGTQVVLATETDDWVSPRWSRDGRYIAYRCSDRELCLIEKAVGQPRPLTDASALVKGHFWSPAGLLFFVMFVHSPDLYSEILSVDPTVGIPRRLSNNPGPDESPSLSPDGTRIAFISAPEIGSLSSVDVMLADGSERHRLFYLDDYHDRYSQLCGWSRAGDRIILRQSPQSFDPMTTRITELYAIGLDGSVSRLTDGNFNTLSCPSWLH
jgi:TolB protein